MVASLGWSSGYKGVVNKVDTALRILDRLGETAAGGGYGRRREERRGRRRKDLLRREKYDMIP